MKRRLTKLTAAGLAVLAFTGCTGGAQETAVCRKHLGPDGPALRPGGPGSPGVVRGVHAGVDGAVPALLKKLAEKRKNLLQF